MITFIIIYFLTGIFSAYFTYRTLKKWLEGSKINYLGYFIIFISLYIGPIGSFATLLTFEKEYWTLK